MLTNARGAAVLAGTVTKATFSGLPIVGCCDDYGNPLLWQPFLGFADALGVPAFVTDIANDGDGPTPALSAALRAYSKWFVPGLSGKPYLEPDGATASPLCGPILTLSSPNESSMPVKADYEARALRNFRRNHKLGLGPSALYVPDGNDPDSDPLPPVYLDHFVVYGGGAQASYYSASDTATSYSSMPYYQILKSCWQSGNWTLNSDQSIWPSLPTTPQVSMKLGIDALRSTGLPERHFFAPLVPLLLLPDYKGGGTFDFAIDPNDAFSGIWLPGHWIGPDLSEVEALAQTAGALPATGELFRFEFQSASPAPATTVLSVYRAPPLKFATFNFAITGLQINAAGLTSGYVDYDVPVGQGDSILIKFEGMSNWTTNGITMKVSYRPTPRTILGVQI